jgi:5-hydroxyisourate hydrolase-like protein (transthyretin family)
MNVQVAVLCDAATDDNGKMNLLGTFDTIYAQQLPAVHPQCAVALRVTFAADDEGQHKLKLNFINADGRVIMPSIEIPVMVTLPDDVHFLTRNFIVNIQQLKFAEAGLYSVDVRLDDKSQANIPLLVKNIPARPAA